MEFKFAAKLEDVLEAAFEDGFPKLNKDVSVPSKL